MTYELRKPNEKEKEELKKYLYIEMFNSNDGDQENIENLVNNAHMGVIENYMSDCPGYAGKVLFIIWGFLGAYELYGWDKEKMLFKVDKEI